MNSGSSIWLHSFQLRPLNVSLLGSCDVVTNFGTTEHVGVGPSTFGDGGNVLDSKQWHVLCGILSPPYLF